MDKENILRNFLPGAERKYDNSRVEFTEFDMSGLHDFYEYSTNSDFFKYLEFGKQNQLSDAVEYIDKVQNRISNGYHGGHAMYWFIKLKKTKKIIGSMALIGVDFNKGIGEIGKGLSPDYWGNGYMFEAVGMYLDFCKNTLGLKEIHSVTRHDNVANIKLMKKRGFNIVGNLESYYKDANGTTHDAITMSILL